MVLNNYNFFKNTKRTSHSTPLSSLNICWYNRWLYVAYILRQKMLFWWWIWKEFVFVWWKGWVAWRWIRREIWWWKGWVVWMWILIPFWWWISRGFWWWIRIRFWWWIRREFWWWISRVSGTCNKQKYKKKFPLHFNRLCKTGKESLNGRLRCSYVCL